MSHGTFATAINCMDGRTQTPVNEYLRKKFNVDYIDTITEPGPNGILAKNSDLKTIESIKKRIEISTIKHGSKHIAVVGHHDCAGNPVDEKTQKDNIIQAIETIKSLGFKEEIIGLWVDSNWNINEISVAEVSGV